MKIPTLKEMSDSITTTIGYGSGFTTMSNNTGAAIYNSVTNTFVPQYKDQTTAYRNAIHFAVDRGVIKSMTNSFNSHEPMYGSTIDIEFALSMNAADMHEFKEICEGARYSWSPPVDDIQRKGQARYAPNSSLDGYRWQVCGIGESCFDVDIRQSAHGNMLNREFSEWSDYVGMQPYAVLNVRSEECGGGAYMVINAKEISIDTQEELDELIAYLQISFDTHKNATTAIQQGVAGMVKHAISTMKDYNNMVDGGVA